MLKGYPTPITIYGVTYRSYREACKHWGISVFMLKYRVRDKGMTPEEAVSTPIDSKHGKKFAVVVFGKTFPSLIQALRQLKVCKSSYYIFRDSHPTYTTTQVIEEYISYKHKKLAKSIAKNYNFNKVPEALLEIEV